MLIANCLFEAGRVHSFVGASLAGARYSFLKRPSPAGTAKLAAEFAGEFGCGEWGEAGFVLLY